MPQPSPSSFHKHRYFLWLDWHSPCATICPIWLSRVECRLKTISQADGQFWTTVLAVLSFCGRQNCVCFSKEQPLVAELRRLTAGWHARVWAVWWAAIRGIYWTSGDQNTSKTNWTSWWGGRVWGRGGCGWWWREGGEQKPVFLVLRHMQSCPIYCQRMMASWAVQHTLGTTVNPVLLDGCLRIDIKCVEEGRSKFSWYYSTCKVIPFMAGEWCCWTHKHSAL